MPKPRPSKGGARPRQTGTLMLRLYGDERAHLDAIRAYLQTQNPHLTTLTIADAVRWSLRETRYRLLGPSKGDL
jgi:hypothetical protein